MHIFFTGATGLIGRHLCPFLLHHHDVTVLSRNPTKAKVLLGHQINAVDSLEDVDFNTVDVVINLAGEPIVNKRWSDKQKTVIRDSRIIVTQAISDAIKQCHTPPHTFISGSAIGYYGRQGDTLVDENNTEPHDEFSHQLCKDWEQAALKAESDETRVCLLRTGIVLAKKGGALGKMLPAFKLCVGGPIGSGEQGMSWIHIDDMVQLILFLIRNKEISGAVNATAPEPLSNKQFSQSLAKALSRPAFMPMPAGVLNILMGEMADLLTTGQYVVPKKALDHNYRFHFTKIDAALESLV
ncbi:Epimerase family protein [Pseudoalteromonas sp. P1-16-1b]|uniref:TIGR01777 family oxidoreductase n=1 Tax=Pseudoalteromonas TaxID=53246 RepID=UPI0006BAFD11|nr:MULTISPECIES: TIGR01777 family oxidoreductase [Pseudoalteromonas]KPH92533.1 epimerase [Pseudoalteromonas undina]KPZ64842.1 Epimerase family protein [Pseudoalteromonas sp. P1-16-1b]